MLLNKINGFPGPCRIELFHLRDDLILHNRIGRLVQCIPYDDARMVPIILEPPGEFLCNLSLGAGRRPERPLVLNQHSISVGSVVPPVIHLPEVVAEEVEIVRLRNVNQRFPDPILTPRERTTIGIGEETMESDVASPEKYILSIEVKISLHNLELAHSKDRFAG